MGSVNTIKIIDAHKQVACYLVREEDEWIFTYLGMLGHRFSTWRSPI